MPTVDASKITMRKLEQVDIECLDAGGHTLALVNITVQQDGNVKITYSEGSRSQVILDKVK